METVTYFVFLGSKNHCMWLQPWNSKTFIPWKENYDKPRKIKKGKESEIVSCSVMSKYLQPHGLYIVCQALLSMGKSKNKIKLKKKKNNVEVNTIKEKSDLATKKKKKKEYWSSLPFIHAILCYDSFIHCIISSI